MNTESETATRKSPHAHDHRLRLGRRLGLREGDALLVADIQRDFLPGGALGVAGGDEIVAPLNSYIDAFGARGLPIFLTRDWHPEEHCSFRSTGGRWPRHCVQNTEGSRWSPELHIPPDAHVISKATDRYAEAYSAFSGTALLRILRDLHVKRLFVGGIATEYCVHDTAVDALSHGLEVVLLGNAMRGINAQPGDETRALGDMLARGATLFQPSQAQRPQPLAPGSPGRQEVTATDYGFGKVVRESFASTLERVRQELQKEGFGVLSDIDVSETLRKKLDAHIPPYRILGACNPPLAHRAVQAEPSIGLLLPCNVVVREDAEGEVHVEFLDPDVLAQLAPGAAVKEIAREVRERLQRVMDSL